MAYFSRQGAFRDELHHHFFIYFQQLAEKRDSDLNWPTNEGIALCNEVNRQRHLRGCLATTNVTYGEYLEQERQAVGHSDYARKLSLYCSELVQR